MLTLYTSDLCPFCYITKSLLKLYFDKDSIKIDDVKNLTITYSKVPVIKVDSEFINNYNDFEDFIKQLSHLTKLNISLDDIYNKLLKIIYSLEDTDTNTNTDIDSDKEIMILFDIMKIKDINYYHNKGYLLAHHIISSGNNTLIKKFILTFFDKLNSFLTKTYIFNNTSFKIYIPSRQNLKHIAAQNNPEIFNKLKIIHEIEDECGNFPTDYYNNRNNISFLNSINKYISSKYEISYDINKLYIDIFENEELKNNIIEEIKSQDKIKPNSMHKTGVILENSKYIKKLIDILNIKYDLNLDLKVYNIYAFTAEYSDGTNNYLDMHKDNSIITINWNLEASDDIEGTNLVIPSMDKIITPKKNQLIIHHGKLEHQVTERVNGSRTNLIIWLK